MINLRFPNITASTTSGQMEQLKSYLHQLVQQLNYEISAGSEQNTAQAAQIQNGKTAQKAVDGTATFSQIKSLIIKSADIVDSYYDEISRRLNGIYVAQSDFGTYSEETTAEISASSKRIEQQYQDIQQILSKLKDVESTQLTVSANIRTGLLFYMGDDNTESTTELPDGTPVYGVEVGQQVNQNGVNVFNKFARFTSYGLIFYDENGVESAYISDSKLRIPNAQIEESMTEGGYEDEVLADGSVVTRWVGV